MRRRYVALAVRRRQQSGAAPDRRCLRQDGGAERPVQRDAGAERQQRAPVEDRQPTASSAPTDATVWPKLPAAYPPRRVSSELAPTPLARTAAPVAPVAPEPPWVQLRRAWKVTAWKQALRWLESYRLSLARHQPRERPPPLRRPGRTPEWPADALRAQAVLRMAAEQMADERQPGREAAQRPPARPWWRSTRPSGYPRSALHRPSARG